MSNPVDNRRSETEIRRKIAALEAQAIVAPTSPEFGKRVAAIAALRWVLNE